jgi:hypothetical protein
MELLKPDTCKKPIIRYDYNKLIEHCTKNNIKLLGVYEGIKITRETKINGRCITDKCSNEFVKMFISLIKTGGYCKECIKNIIKDKVKITCLKKYGVESAFQSKELKNKGKITNLKKYGVEHSSQLKETQDKKKITNLKKYGVEHSTQTEEVKDKRKETCLKKYGVEHPFQSEEIKDKFKATCLEKYGFSNPFQSEEIKDKIKVTCLEKYGVEYSSQSEDVKDKLKATCLEKYGCENPAQSKEIKDKMKEICLEKYGVKNHFQSEEIKNKSKATCLEKYGVEHSNQNAEQYAKISKKAYKFKDYVLPSGKIIKVQGYEPFGLNYLLNVEKILEDDIITGVQNVPKIWYKDNDGISHTHYPDIWIPSQNRCIEIKSTWTAEKKKDCIYLKQLAGQNMGMTYDLWIYNTKGERV